MGNANQFDIYVYTRSVPFFFVHDVARDGSYLFLNSPFFKIEIYQSERYFHASFGPISCGAYSCTKASYNRNDEK